MKKIAILGSKGYVGNNLAFILSDFSGLTLFSHQSNIIFDGQFGYKTNEYEASSILGFVNDFDLIIFLLDSNESYDKEQIYDLFNSIIHESLKTKVIFFSTFSIYSSWKSPYTAFKERIETLSQGNNNVYILRPGVIYGGNPGGLYKTFLRLSKRLFLVLPAADAVTGYVHIQQVAKFIKKMCSTNTVTKITPLVDFYLPISEMLRLLKFKGLVVPISIKMIRPILYPLSMVKNKIPRSVHSLASLVAMNIPHDLELNNSGKCIIRKIILSQFVSVNKVKKIKFNIRRFIRAIEGSNSHEKYLTLSKSEKYIFLKRLYEIYSLNLGAA